MSAAYIALLVIGAILAVALIGLILLHAPKGDGMAGIGAAATVFSGKRGAEAGLDAALPLFEQKMLNRSSRVVVGSQRNSTASPFTSVCT